MNANLTVTHTATNVPVSAVKADDLVTVCGIKGKVVGATQVTDELTTIIVTLPSVARVTVSRA